MKALDVINLGKRYTDIRVLVGDNLPCYDFLKLVAEKEGWVKDPLADTEVWTWITGDVVIARTQEPEDFGAVAGYNLARRIDNTVFSKLSGIIVPQNWFDVVMLKIWRNQKFLKVLLIVEYFPQTGDTNRAIDQFVGKLNEVTETFFEKQ